MGVLPLQSLHLLCLIEIQAAVFLAPTEITLIGWPDADRKSEVNDQDTEIRKYISRIEAHHSQTRILFDLENLQKDSSLDAQQILSRSLAATETEVTIEINGSKLVLIAHGAISRNGGRKSVERRHDQDWKTPSRRINPNLVKALTRAHVWRDMIEAGEVKTIDQLAGHAKTERKHLRRVLRLSFLAPDIQQAILSGRQPSSLTLTTLIKGDLPASWAEQRVVLGLT